MSVRLVMDLTSREEGRSKNPYKSGGLALEQKFTANPASEDMALINS